MKMTVDFCDYFWGEKNNGFDVLYQNTKHGQLASKELMEFFKERAMLEESYSKMLAKLAHKASGAGTGGTFGPLWAVLRASSEKLSSIHMAAVTQLADVVRELQKYTDDLHRRQKTVKEEEAPTMEVVQSIQQLTVSVTKARELYHGRAAELRKLQESTDKAAGRDTDKAEAKLRKAADEYRALVDKYTLVRDQFERKMVVSCRHFQELEENYLCQMKDFLDSYIKVFDTSQLQVAEVNAELRRQCDEKAVLKLLEEFALSRLTGLEKPAVLGFEEVPVSPSVGSVGSTPDAGSDTGSADAGAPPPSAAAAAAPAPTRTGELASATLPGSSWTTGFLRARRAKRDKLKKREQDCKSDSEENHPASPEVDEEGFSVRPRNDAVNKRGDSFYSTSDSDSDEDPVGKIHVKIRPLSNGTAISASVDELRHVTSGLTLSPANTGSKSAAVTEEDSGLRRSQSVSQQLGSERLGGPLATLRLNSPPGSSLPTPTSHAAPPPAASPATAAYAASPATAAYAASPATAAPGRPANASIYAELSELFSSSADVPPALPPKQQPQPSPQTQTQSSSSSARSATPTLASIAIPRPPSRRSLEGGGTLRGRHSPALSSPVSRVATPASGGSGATPTARQESAVAVGGSRGPSPLTLGLSDTVPLAVAFQEVVHAYFRGSDPARCQVRMTGDMMVSFPSGIVQVLTSNPSPAPLLFRLNHIGRLESLLPNKHLVTQELKLGGLDTAVFEFRMDNLTMLLRKQAERNPTASYFNVDILKYQIVTQQSAAAVPLVLVAYWKCEPTHTDLKVEYRYNGAALSLPRPLHQVSVAAPVHGGVTTMHSKPTGKWVEESSRVLWRLPEVSSGSAGDAGSGALKARFELSNGPGSPGTLAAQFTCEGSTLSGAEFQLLGTGYRLSLVKRRCVSGKYICDSDYIESSDRYAAPPSSH